MANAQDNHTDESSGQDSEKSGVFGGIANKLSSSMGAGQGNADDQGYLSQGEASDRHLDRGAEY